MKKKIVTMLLALAMVCSMAACGGNGGSASSAAVSGSTPAEETQAAAPAQENTQTSAETGSEMEGSGAETAAEATGAYGEDRPISDIVKDMEPTELPLSDGSTTFDVWMAAPGTVSQVEDLANANETYAELQTRTGVGIHFQMANFFTQMDQFNLMAASGDFPGIMNGAATLYNAGPDAALDEEIFVNLQDYEDLMPHYSAIINSDPNVFNEVSTPEGNLVAFYSLYDYNKYGGRGDKGYFIRQDWLDDLGLDMPKTYDQLHDVLTAFKTEKGADSAFVLPVSGMNDFVTGGFGIGSTFYVEDGTIKFGPLEQGYRDYLELMAQWYSEGLIYADYYNYANEIMFDGTDMIGDGQVALYYNEVGTMTTYAEYSKDPNFMVRAIAPVSQEEGGKIYPTEFHYTPVDNARWSITTTCPDPELAVQLCDYMYTTDGILLANYGVEDVTFTYNAEGKPEFTDLIMNNPDGYSYRDSVALHVIDGMGTIYDALRGASNYTELQLSAFDDWMDANLDYSRALPSTEMLNMDEKAEYASIYSDVETFLKEAIAKYIIGDYSFDTYDTDFVGKLEGMDIERCVELYQQAYDRYMENHAA